MCRDTWRRVATRPELTPQPQPLPEGLPGSPGGDQEPGHRALALLLGAGARPRCRSLRLSGLEQGARLWGRRPSQHDTGHLQEPRCPAGLCAVHSRALEGQGCTIPGSFPPPCPPLTWATSPWPSAAAWCGTASSSPDRVCARTTRLSPPHGAEPLNHQAQGLRGPLPPTRPPTAHGPHGRGSQGTWGSPRAGPCPHHPSWVQEARICPQVSPGICPIARGGWRQPRQQQQHLLQPQVGTSHRARGGSRPQGALRGAVTAISQASADGVRHPLGHGRQVAAWELSPGRSPRKSSARRERGCSRSGATGGLAAQPRKPPSSGGRASCPSPAPRPTPLTSSTWGPRPSRIRCAASAFFCRVARGGRNRRDREQASTAGSAPPGTPVRSPGEGPGAGTAAQRPRAPWWPGKPTRSGLKPRSIPTPARALLGVAQVWVLATLRPGAGPAALLDSWATMGPPASLCHNPGCPRKTGTRGRKGSGADSTGWP